MSSGIISHQQDKNTNRNEVARRRWKILARALRKNGETYTSSNGDNLISVRRFTTFNLISSQPFSFQDNDVNTAWFEYFAKLFGEIYSLYIRHPTRSFTAVELIGFNNTGNICIWPSEEVLAYFCLYNREIFSGKSVLELGGGMTCLAGLFIAKYSTAVKIELTDGNSIAVDNVHCILGQNNFLQSDRVSCSVLQWGDFREKYSDHPKKYDIVLSADCLFFDEARQDLVETIWATLNENGVAFVMAPQRGNTFNEFSEEAKTKGFNCKSRYQYNDHVWNRHIQMKENHDYDENLHYPLLLMLTKSNKTVFWGDKEQCI